MRTQMNYCVSSDFAQPPLLLLHHGPRGQWQAPSLSPAASGSLNTSLVPQRCRVFTPGCGARRSSVHMAGWGPRAGQEGQGHPARSRTRGDASPVLSSCAPGQRLPKTLLSCRCQTARTHLVRSFGVLLLLLCFCFGFNGKSKFCMAVPLPLWHVFLRFRSFTPRSSWREPARCSICRRSASLSTPFPSSSSAVAARGSSVTL